MPYPSEHAARMADPGGFKTFRRQNGKMGEGVDAIFGIGEDGKTKLQAIRFDASRFSPERARAWLKEHDFAPILFEPAADEKKTKEKALALLQKYSDDQERDDSGRWTSGGGGGGGGGAKTGGEEEDDGEGASAQKERERYAEHEEINQRPSLRKLKEIQSAEYETAQDARAAYDTAEDLADGFGDAAEGMRRVVELNTNPHRADEYGRFKAKMEAAEADAREVMAQIKEDWRDDPDWSRTKEKAMEGEALLQKTFRNWIAQPVSADRNARRLKVVFSTPDQDLDGDVIEELDTKEYSGVVLWHHDQKQLPPAKMLSIEKKDGKWMGEVEFAEDVTVLVGKDAKAGIPGIPVTSKQLFAWYADGFLKGWSVGVLPTERGKGKDSNRVKGKLVEVSMVPVGSNPKALTMSAEGAPLLTKELLRGLGALPEKATVAELAESGWEVSPSALLKSVREKGIPLPEGMELEVEPMEVKDGKVLQARIAGWRTKAKAPPPPKEEPETDPATSEEMDGAMTCPECGAKGKGPECPDCGAKMVAAKKALPPEKKEAPAEDLLQKEGRILSGKNRERLALLMEALGKSWDELEALLKETAPVEKPRRTEPVHDVVLDQEQALPKARLKAASLLAKLAVSSPTK